MQAADCLQKRVSESLSSRTAKGDQQRHQAYPREPLGPVNKNSSTDFFF